MMNCAGYALDIDSWIWTGRPIPSCEEANPYSVLRRILKRYQHLNIRITKVPECKEDEVLIAFRIGKLKSHDYWDFHFVKLCDDGVWRGKEGHSGIVSYNHDIALPWYRSDDAFAYDSKIIFMTYKKSNPPRL